MKIIEAKTLFIFFLVCTTAVKSGPALPVCTAACYSSCLLTFLYYVACIIACLASCGLTCFSNDTLVTKLLDEKAIQLPISQIQVGDFVLTKSGFSKVVANQKVSEPIQFWRMTFDDNSFIEVTPRHPILNENWTAVKQLKEGMLIGEKSIKTIEPIQRNERFIIVTESGTITLGGCEFGAFVFSGENYESAHQEWTALFR